MKSLRFVFVPIGVAIAVLAPGCSNLTPSAQTQARIQQKPATYNALKPEQQADILGGAIERGNTTDMVFMALGKPAKVVTSADGIKAMWVYIEYYAPAAAFTTSFNNPNSTRYTPSETNSNVKDGPPGVPSLNAPGHLEGLPAWIRPQVFGGTSNATPVQSLDVPQMKSKTVYVFFVAGRVAEIKLDGDSSDQKTAAPNAPIKASS